MSDKQAADEGRYSEDRAVGFLAVGLGLARRPLLDSEHGSRRGAAHYAFRPRRLYPGAGLRLARSPQNRLMSTYHNLLRMWAEV